MVIRLAGSTNPGLLGTEPFIEYLLSSVYSVVVTEDNGCTFEIDNVDATTNIPHHEGVSWGMFPNPASNVVTFTDIPVDGSWTLVTLDGRTVRTGRGGTSMTVDVSSLQAECTWFAWGRTISGGSKAVGAPAQIETDSLKEDEFRCGASRNGCGCARAFEGHHIAVLGHSWAHLPD